MRASSAPRWWLAGLAASVLFSLFINLGTVSALFKGNAGLAQMGTSPDEEYYFALIRDAATGYPNLGNATSKEHRGESATASYAPLLQGFVMRLFRLSIETTVFLGDFLFPVLSVFLLFLILRWFLVDETLSAVAAFGVASISIGFGILRTISPQATLPFLLGYLACFLILRRSRSGYAIRGILIALLLSVHVLYALYLCCVEGIDALARLAHRDVRRTLFRDLAVLSLCVGLGVLAKTALALHTSDPIAVLDTYRRAGIIPSHLPADPRLQLTVLLTIFALFLVRYAVPAS